MPPQKFTVIGVGEVLMDVFENGLATVGGAPLNVTFHLNQLLREFGLGKACIVSRVGRDEAGDEILKYLSFAQMEISSVTRDPLRPTGTATVFSHQGTVGFEIAQDVAWDEIPYTSELAESARGAAAVVFGSLGQRSMTSRKTIRNLVAEVAGERLYDVNLRRNTKTRIAGYSDEIVRHSLELATIVKLNDEEIEEVAAMLGLSSAEQDEERQWDLVTQIGMRFDLSVVALTRGPKGALVYGSGRRYRLADSNLPQHEVHPVGAGDAFAAGLLFGRIQGWNLEACLELANTLAAWVVGHISATPTLNREVLAVVESICERANLETSQGV